MNPPKRQSVAQISAELCIHVVTVYSGVVESFFATLKHEMDLDEDAGILNSPQLLIREMAFWIDGYYNRERRH